MGDWKSKLYESYITTGQATTLSDDISGLRVSDYPQLVRLIRLHLPADRSIRIADLGCGHGALVYCLQQAGYSKAEGVDVSPEQVAHAHKLGIANIRQGELMEYISTLQKKQDVFFLMDVLEHLEKQEVMDLLTQAHQALTDNGRIILHVPNAEGIFGMRVRYGDFTHELCFTPQSIRQVLQACGFESIQVYEEKPVVHGLKSFARSVLWQTLTLPARLLLLAETGAKGHVLSQNMLVTVRKQAE